MNCKNKLIDIFTCFFISSLLTSCVPQHLLNMNEESIVEVVNLKEGRTNIKATDQVTTKIEKPTEIVSQFSKSEFSNVIEIDFTKETPSIRAKTSTENGTLVLVSRGREEIGHLTVPSMSGIEGDTTFQSNYDIVYEHNGKRLTILSLPELTLIQPTDKLLSFDKIVFKDADVYLFNPRYTSGYGIQFYAMAIPNGGGEPIPLHFIKGGYLLEHITYSSLNPPINKKERLVIVPEERAGSSKEELKEVNYVLDIKNKRFVAE
ncbi:hypothetical protein [Paenibacillus sp. Marseille-Q4541]|uniref:hypothetical protein n=1 Tax=Paenibacillus sp. Marseille-Q4541 TaxID=2831522 RepID=UPI001BABA551|nr:hypothetical protein [Paenibacillus sp. Marseille-Q4541]